MAAVFHFSADQIKYSLSRLFHLSRLFYSFLGILTSLFWSREHTPCVFCTYRYTSGRTAVLS